MVMETIDKVVKDLGSADIDARLEELLIDGIPLCLPGTGVFRHFHLNYSA